MSPHTSAIKPRRAVAEQQIDASRKKQKDNCEKIKNDRKNKQEWNKFDKKTNKNRNKKEKNMKKESN